MKNLYCLLAGTAIFLISSPAFSQVKSIPVNPNQVPEPQTVAGRVMTVDRPNKTFTIRPYKNLKIEEEVKFVVDNKTVYEWNVAAKDAKTPTLNDVKRGSWVRVNYVGTNVQKVFVHVPR